METIKKAVISAPGKDDTNIPVQQITYLNKTGNTEILFPYGMHANLPVDSLMVVFPIMGQSSNLVAIGGMPNKRIQVDEGEIVVFHPETKSKIHFRSNGDIDIETDSNMNVKAPQTNWEGDITVTGSLTVDEAFIGGIQFTTHTHPYTDDGSPMTTGVPQ